MRPPGLRIAVRVLAAAVVAAGLALWAIWSNPPRQDAPITRAFKVPAPAEGITLTRHPGLAFRGQFDEVNIRRDGTVVREGFGIRDGKAYEESFVGTVGQDEVRRLEDLLDRHRFFDLKETAIPMDLPYVMITATVGRRSHFYVVREPNECTAIIAAIDALVAGVADWKKVK